MAESSSPVEVFKRSTTAALRAIAEREDVTVTYGPEPPGLAGPRARLPMPPRDLSQQEASLVRGAADALALRLRYHDAQLHTRRLPQNEVARAIFEGVEQARVEALGARRMSGVAANLAAAHFGYQLPEVFAGMRRSETPFPIAYPTAARPQAWAAGTPVLLLQVLLGLQPDRQRHSLQTLAPQELPSWAGTIRLTGVRAFDRAWDVRLDEGHVKVEEA